MSLTTHGLTPSLERVLHTSVVPALPYNIELAVVGAGPLVSKRLDETRVDDWLQHLSRVKYAIATAQSAALAAGELGRTPFVFFLTHPPGTFAQSSSMLSAVSESVLRGFVRTDGIKATNTAAVCNLVTLRFTGWGFDASDIDAVDEFAVARLIVQLIRPPAHQIDGTVISVDGRGWVVVDADAGSPLLRLDDS
ncbi:hypothetical protein [Rhodococcus jostii]|uniref:Uncharacterized protein n=1 Tax=Rhodococcus jostii TaxID=132919 RepID=A0ABU4CSL0_RHOJO|nr:hypothetical protein [Rhodococcus jostii]MDV6286572.1 hypothetical protein [Rhodococcus jostii]